MVTKRTMGERMKGGAVMDDKSPEKPARLSNEGIERGDLASALNLLNAVATVNLAAKHRAELLTPQKDLGQPSVPPHKG